MESSSAYARRNVDGLEPRASQISATASASLRAPAPPSAKCVASTAAAAPASRQARMTIAISASVSAAKRFTATTQGTPKTPVTVRTCFCTFATPALKRSRSSLVYAAASLAPGTTGGPPPCIFSARTVATTTQQSGSRPLPRHLMSTNFSKPMSAPKPASVTTKPVWPTSASPVLSAMTEELPCAMFANGPPCTSTGVASSVCIIVGMRASLSSTASAPAQPKSSTVTTAPPCKPALDRATLISPRRRRMSAMSEARATTAAISEATAMSKPHSRVCPFSAAPRPTSTVRRNRSHVSKTRFHQIESWSTSHRAKRVRSASSIKAPSPPAGREMPSLSSLRSCESTSGRVPSLRAGARRLKRAASFCVASWNMRASSAAATKLFAATMAWMSPVMCRLNSSMGTTCE
mmetsp:Transcript_5874/g.18677  ORF Transcript_5874/g.18677 Transcript_5874/m.18677 type:complete len:407 (+) Transcript_5874:455-1675(+)